MALVPEINLAPQALDAFRRAGVVRAALYHSELRPRERADVWIPTNLESSRGAERGNQYLAVLARLRPGATPAQAAADLGVMRERFRGARLESGNRGNDIEPRPYGSFGIVFVRDWITEIGQYPVAPELGEKPVIGSRNTGTGGVIGIGHDAHVLRIESGR